VVGEEERLATGRTRRRERETGDDGRAYV